MVLVDTGMRPDECYRLRWENLSWKNGSNGTVLVTHGKTAAARRMLYLTLETRWEIAGRPLEGVDLASSHKEWSPKRFKPQEAACPRIQDRE